MPESGPKPPSCTLPLASNVGSSISTPLSRMHSAKARRASWVSAGVDVSVVAASLVESTSSDATCDPPDASPPHAVAKVMSAQPSASPVLVERDLGEIRMRHSRERTSEFAVTDPPVRRESSSPRRRPRRGAVVGGADRQGDPHRRADARDAVDTNAPPWASIAVSAIDRPRPLPPRLRVRLGSALKKRSITPRRSRAACRARDRRRRQRHSRHRVAGAARSPRRSMWTRALPTTLASTCRRRSSSPVTTTGPSISVQIDRPGATAPRRGQRRRSARRDRPIGSRAAGPGRAWRASACRRRVDPSGSPPARFVASPRPTGAARADPRFGTVLHTHGSW